MIIVMVVTIRQYLINIFFYEILSIGTIIFDEHYFYLPNFHYFLSQLTQVFTSITWQICLLEAGIKNKLMVKLKFKFISALEKPSFLNQLLYKLSYQKEMV